MTKNNFIHLFLFALLQMGALNTFAYDIEYNGFYYNLDEEKKEATLTYKEKYKATEEYTGEIDVPLTIKVGDDAYTVTHIGDYAFYNCDNITEVFIHYKIESIGEHAFQSCDNIEIVEVGMHNAYGNPKGLIIDDYAFSYCSKLEGVYMYGLVPNIRYLSKIGFRAFEGCSSLTKFRIDKQTETVGHLAFYGCNNLATLSVQDGNPVYDSRNNCNAIIETNTNKLVIGCKSTIIPNTVTEIAYEAFKGCSGLKEINIPNSVTSIGNEAFSYSGLERITHMPENLTYLGKAFSHCENLKELIIPDAVESLGYEALQGCVGLKSLYIGKALTQSYDSKGYKGLLTSSPFSSCINLESIIVSPENPEYDSRDNSNAIIRTSSNSLIFGCRNTTIPNTVTGIGDEAFHMSQLTEITLPETVVSIGKRAFALSSNLVTVKTEGQIIYIAEGAFYSCRSLKNVEGVCKQIGTDAFFGCSKLESIDIDSSNGFIGEAAFYGCANLQSVTIPSQDIIYTSTFLGCKKLTNIVIPDYVKEIRPSAFYGCTSLESLTIGKGINKTLGNSIVGECSNLQKIYIRNTDTFYYATQNTFNYNIYEGCTLYVPKGYSTVGSWGVDWNYFKNFENIVENHFSLDENTDIDINISSAEWSTMILPFDAEIPSGMNVYSCSKSSDNILTLEPVSTIKANTPYLINGEPRTYTFSAIGSAWEDLYNDGWFTGAYVETEVPENSYILAKVNGLIGFYKVTGANVGNTKIAPYHCYLTVDSYSSAKSNALYFDDATTNITNINDDTTTAQKTRYNLSGQRIDNNVKGIVIEKGKKIIVK